MGYDTYEEDFAIRLTKLRIQKGVSARDMSLSIGQNPGYINNIETKKAMPSMASFFFICEYLNVTPQEFFDTSTDYPEIVREITIDLRALSLEQPKNISGIVKGLKHNK